MSIPFIAVKPILFVDADGTLFPGDLFLEGALRFLASSPLNLFRFLGWLLQGRSIAKAGIAAAAPIAPADLPCNEELPDYSRRSGHCRSNIVGPLFALLTFLMTPLSFALILSAVLLSACAQLVMKLGVNGLLAANGEDMGAMTLILKSALSPLVISGLAIYVASVGLWLYVLAKTDLTVAYPFVGISFIATLFFGVFFLGENVTATRITGTLLIAVGCILVARSV